MGLGDLQYLTLLAVARLGTEAYAREIRDLLSTEAGRDVQVATVFVTLTRLEDQGMVTSSLGAAPPRGGRAPRIFELTDDGWEAIRRAREVQDRMWRGVEAT